LTLAGAKADHKMFMKLDLLHVPGRYVPVINGAWSSQSFPELFLTSFFCESNIQEKLKI